MSPWNLRCLAYQFAEEPESAVTIALPGSRDDSSWNSRIGLIGSASTMASAFITSDQRVTLDSMSSRQDLSSLRRRCGMSARSVAAASPTRLTCYG